MNDGNDMCAITLLWNVDVGGVEQTASKLIKKKMGS